MPENLCDAAVTQEALEKKTEIKKLYYVFFFLISSLLRLSIHSSQLPLLIVDNLEVEGAVTDFKSDLGSVFNQKENL